MKSVNEDWSVTLEDGRTVRMAGVEPVGPTGHDPALVETARRRLASWLNGSDASLSAVGAGLDRWGRMAGLLFAPDGSQTPLSVSLALVDAGLARARPETLVPAACWTTMLGAEARARDDRVGLWEDPAYAILHPSDSETLAANLGTMVVIEGRIARIHSGRSRLFITLADKEGDVTISVAHRDLFILNQVGLNGAGAVGATVRVRGDLEERAGGFSIDVRASAAIEVLDRSHD